MPGKAKTQKHTAKELNKKAAMAMAKKGGVGGGAAGAAARGCNMKFLECEYCKAQIASLADMKAHMGSKHDKLPFDVAKYEKMAADAKAATAAENRAKSGQQNKKGAPAGGAKKSTRSKKGVAAGGPLPDDLMAAMAGASVSKKKKKK